MQFCCNFLRAADPFLLGFLLPGTQNQPNLVKIYIRKSDNSLNIILILGSVADYNVAWQDADADYEAG